MSDSKIWNRSGRGGHDGIGVEARGGTRAVRIVS